MTESVIRFASGDDPLFIVWGPPSYGPRSKIFARAVGADIEFIHTVKGRGPWVAPVKYVAQFVRTVRLLRSRRPHTVFVQSPPSFAPLTVWLVGRWSGVRLVIDAHSDAFQAPHWTRPRWLYRRLARAAAATVVTNEHFAELVRGWGATAVVLQDIPARFPEGGTYPFADGFNVTVVSTFADDEPIGEVLDAAASLDGVVFHVTGNIDRADRTLVSSAPENVIFTGFLSDDDYYELLRGSDAVMCLTTRDNTMQRGACEALSLGRPIITSDWPLLRSYFSEGAAHVDNTVDGIRLGVGAVRADHDSYLKGIEALQSVQRAQFERSFGVLAEKLGAEISDQRGEEPWRR